ncbi:MAG: AMP-binding protein, partial [Thermomicrobiales bacterium]
MSDNVKLPDSVNTIPEALAFWADRTPGAPAVRAIDGRELSHGELLEAVNRVGVRLCALGIQGDARVAMTLQGGADPCVALLGTMAVAVAVPFNPAATAHELTSDLKRLRPRLLVTGGPAETLSRSVAATLG